jgi:hypothetical protein
MADRNIAAGLGLAIFGATFALGAYLLLGNIPLTATGIGVAVFGVALALTPLSPIPKQAVISFVRNSCGSIEALLEAAGATSRAVYLPRGNSGVIAYVPLKSGGEVSLQAVAQNDGGIIVRHGGCLGIMVFPPSLGFEAGNPGADSILDVAVQLENVLVEAAEIAEGVTAVDSEGEIRLEIYRPRLDVDYPRFRIVMGSLASCLAAQVVAAATSRPVQIVEEKRSGKNLSVRLRLLNWTDTLST